MYVCREGGSARLVQQDDQVFEMVRGGHPRHTTGKHFDGSWVGLSSGPVHDEPSGLGVANHLGPTARIIRADHHTRCGGRSARPTRPFEPGGLGTLAQTVHRE
jgi:hypothetical protein